ncbi:hypothetical protein HS088_TW07G00647 [Tripterygium wilfordii]|uniref:Uncharacterized protein n=1 Tax=Tripterygium wilfordii TaxID=458696 RepID=A0A7J7DG88_TRIWF|nr:protein BPS1, chloroplastic-like [Tripterygium wilfordii]KAF5745066.1 hypothetical protein HS088_TW07G00647 [Tripterygium wilfordii]
MKPSSILRGLSFRIHARISASPAAVAPLPVRTQFDQRLTSELDALHDQSPAFGINGTGYASAAWIIDLLAASAATQKIEQESLINVVAQDSDRKLIDEYLDFNVDILDACNEASEKLEIMQSYIQSLRIVAHSVEANFEPNSATTARARHMLDSCIVIERSREMNSKRSCSKSKKLLSQRCSPGKSSGGTTQLGEILTGSTAMTSLVCRILGITLSFKSSKHMFPSMQLQSTNSWSFSLLGLQKKVTESSRGAGSTMLAELRRTIEASRNLRDCLAESDEIGVAVEELTRSCGELEEGIKGLEGEVKELYKGLIAVRMALLDSLSKA